MTSEIVGVIIVTTITCLTLGFEVLQVGLGPQK